MAGGIGSRFWPMSTQQNPKQFQDILGIGRTMIQQTFDRIKKVIPPENILVITNREYIELCREQLPEIPAENIVGEPMMRNTAACNLYMAKKILAKNAEANIVVLPADHLILKEDAFAEKIESALAAAAENECLITLGIQPTRPDTGYGYINFAENGGEISKVKKFTEKPKLEIAQEFLQSGEYLWNAGIFVWNANTILKAFAKHLPEMLQEFEKCEFNTEKEAECIAEIYPKVENISIDNGILERADNVFVIPADLGWTDLGTWTSVFENAEKDAERNSVNSEKIFLYNAEGNTVRMPAGKVAVIDGLQDFIVVDTKDALLICPRKNDQLIKEYVGKLRD